MLRRTLKQAAIGFLIGIVIGNLIAVLTGVVYKSISNLITQEKYQVKGR